MSGAKTSARHRAHKQKGEKKEQKQLKAKDDVCKENAAGRN